jgi:hypothetical protein
VAVTLDPMLFLPDPESAEVRVTVISVDNHVVEPPHLFTTWLPKALRGRGPQMVEDHRRALVWEFEGAVHSQVGMNAVAGRRPETVRLEPFRFDQMRPGCYDAHERVRACPDAQALLRERGRAVPPPTA